MKHDTHSSKPGPNRRSQLLWTLLVLAVLGYAARFAWRAHQNLVTFDVREMEVRKVVKKMAWQTWEDIHVHQEVQGKITLKVVNMPLEEALRLVSAQAQSRSVLFYALYSGGASLKRLEQSLRGEVEPATHGWTNLASRAGGGFGGLGGFGRPGGPGGGMFGFTIPGAPAQVGGNGLVSLNLAGKTVDFAALAFTRFAQTRVVPEDGVKEIVTLTLDQVPIEPAVAKLAKAAKRKWIGVYALQGGFGFDRGGDRDRPRVADGGTNRPAWGGFGGLEMTEAQRDEMRAQREAQELALREALPSAARQKYEQAQQEREAALRDMQNLTPDQMRDRFTSQNSAAMNQMMRDRVMNSTPEQRAQQGQRRNAGRGGGGPGSGPGGPGGGGPR